MKTVIKNFNMVMIEKNGGEMTTVMKEVVMT